MIIRVIVHAKDEEEALKKGKDALDRLTKGEKPFDYYITFESTKNDDDWKGDWAHLPAVVLASSPEGQHFIQKGWRLTVEGFMEALEKVTLAIQHLTPEELMEETPPANLPEDIKGKMDPSHVRYYFHELSDMEGGYPYFVYSEHEPITSKRDLEFALNPEEGLKAYVIPAYVHY
jgi:hypothetical protein